MDLMRCEVAAAAERSMPRPSFLTLVPELLLDAGALRRRFGLPVLCTAMGRGLVPDAHPLCVNAARSTALREADVALVVGARLNW